MTLAIREVRAAWCGTPGAESTPLPAALHLRQEALGYTVRGDVTPAATA